jgi:hypothetical protein
LRECRCASEVKQDNRKKKPASANSLKPMEVFPFHCIPREQHF